MLSLTTVALKTLQIMQEKNFVSRKILKEKGEKHDNSRVNADTSIGTRAFGITLHDKINQEFS